MKMCRGGADNVRGRLATRERWKEPQEENSLRQHPRLEKGVGVVGRYEVSKSRSTQKISAKASIVERILIGGCFTLSFFLLLFLSLSYILTFRHRRPLG